MSLKQYEPCIKEFLAMMKDAKIDYSCWFTDDKDILGSRSMHPEEWLRLMVRELKDWCEKLDNPGLFMKTLLDAIKTEVVEKNITLSKSMKIVTDEHTVTKLEALLASHSVKSMTKH